MNMQIMLRKMWRSSDDKVEEWRLIPFERFTAFENMAIDEAIFKEAKKGEIPPTLRLYGWKKPAVSVGYFQDVAGEVNYNLCHNLNIDIVRRPTGGKAVFHGCDLTYALVAGQNSHGFYSDILETYRVISECIIRGLEKLGINACMVKEGRHSESGALKGFCFSVPVRNELLVDGRKICGSAQVRSRGAFLQHGSIPVDLDIETTCRIMSGTGEDIQRKAEVLQRSVTCVNEHVDGKVEINVLCECIMQGFEEYMGIKLVEGGLRSEEKVLKERLVKDKFLNPMWNMEGKVSVNGC
jgi:lipoate-protein ligase A